MKKLVLEVEIGNDAMRTKAHIVRALLALRRSVGRDLNLRDKRIGANSGTVRDVNGNTVGRWELRDKP